MPENRFFTFEPIQENSSICLDVEESHHLIHVMRLPINSSLEIINGKGYLGTATFTDIKHKQAEVLVTGVKHYQPRLKPVWLYQAICRPNRLHYIIEKSVELGVDKILFFPGNHSEIKTLSEQKLQKLQRIAIAAIKQCGRLYLPEILLIPAIEKWKPESFPLFYGDIQQEATPLFLYLEKLKMSPSHIGFIVGPEKGLTPQETKKLEQLRAVGTSLHHHILRTDTAPIVALSLIQHFQLCQNQE